MYRIYTPAAVSSLMPVQRTALRELVEARLGMDVCEWVARRRQEVPEIGWRTLAAEISVITGRTLSHGSLASWCRPGG